MALTPTSSHGAATTVATDAIWDAKGDMVSGTGADAAARTAVGTDGTVWTADAASTAGAKWAAASTGALTLLSTTTLGGAGTFDVSAISGAYNDLILVLIARGARVAQFTDEIQLRFNNDSGSSYSRENVSALSTTVAGVQSGTTTSILTAGGGIPAASAPANSFGVWEATVYGYASTTWLKALNYAAFDYADPGSGSQVFIRGGGVWISTAAITRVQIQGQTTANLVTGSQLRIYGRL